MNELEATFYSVHPHRIKIYLLYTAFLFNVYVIRSQRLQDILWEWLRTELFYIAGACQHSGNCCRYLMLYNKGKALNRPELFQKAAQEKPYYSRFIPQMTTSGGIDHFQCNCLSAENKCTDYKNRPRLCQQYPIGNFLKGGDLHGDCGYTVRLRENIPIFHNRTVLALLVETARLQGWQL